MRTARSLPSLARRADKRGAILRAAIRVFANNGYFNSKSRHCSRGGVAERHRLSSISRARKKSCHSVFDRSMEEAIR